MEPMQKMVEDTCLPVDIDAQPLVQAAAALLPVIRGYHEEIEREQRLPKALVERFHAAGFYSMVIPRELGGLQADPLTYLRVVELLAEGAGSVGWNLANNSIGQLLTLGLPDEGVHEIYAHGADTVIAGTAVGRVCARSGADLVGSRAGVDLVVSAPRFDVVRRPRADDDVGVVVADDRRGRCDRGGRQRHH